MALFARVILDVSTKEIDRIFDYAVPEELCHSIQRGMRVLVPFGARNGRKEGYIIDLCGETEVPLGKIKQIISLLDNGPLFSDTMISLALWMQKKYYATLSQCLQTIMPAGIKSRTEWVVEQIAEELPQGLTSKEMQVFEAVSEGADYRELEELFGKNIQGLLKDLSKKGIVALKQSTAKKDYKKTEKFVSLMVDGHLLEMEKERTEKSKTLQAQNKILSYLEQHGQTSKKTLLEVLKMTDVPLKTLAKRGIVTIVEKEVKRDVFRFEGNDKTKGPILSADQKRALAEIWHELHQQKKRPILIHGITGSGKTELYMRLIEKMISEGKQAIVLVPEISLTPQMVGRFISRFGDAATVTHSRLSLGERYDQWKKARDGEISIMIGPRSAVFAPFANLGAVIVDEEHENTYQSDTTPKYDARVVAEKLCELTGAALIMGSATPSLNNYYRAEKGEVCLVRLPRRIGNSQLPLVHVVDMREELENGNRSIFSQGLFEAMHHNLEKKEQTILFLNRRGYSTFVSCRKCGYVVKCNSCNVSYTYHANENKLLCHYCGSQIDIPKICPVCGSKYIKYFGTGTQKVESEVQRLFPEAKVLRMDLDTTTKKHSHENILQAFGKGEADILIGTQMIAKGHDFPKVTLVGILAADLSLNAGDFRSAETTFQLVTQVAGRAGRNELKGQVYIQTYRPDHYSIILAAAQDYESFYEEEMKYRKTMEYPPYSHIFTILLTGSSEQKVAEAAGRLRSILDYYNRGRDFQVMGPSPATISKIKNQYRWRLILKYPEEERLLSYGLYCVGKLHSDGNYREIYANVTMDPSMIV